jgi:hypothetical protein
MKKLLVFCLILIAGSQIASAQDRSDIKAEMQEQRNAIFKERQNSKSNARTNAPSAAPADVGDPDSFGKNALFLGVVTSGVVFIDPTCDPADIGPLGPDDHCISPDANGIVPTTTFNDIGRITIPGKSVSNIIYAIANNTASFSFFNANATPQQARMSYVPTVTFESEALNDPSLIDPNTGNPFNGSFTTGNLGTLTNSKTLASAASELQTHSYTRANTLGFSRAFWAALGLPPAVIDQIYKKPATIRLNIRVSSKLSDSAVLAYTIRFLGN